MPSIRKWEPEEVAALTAQKQDNGKGRKEVEATYDQFIADLSAGDYATLTLDEGENKPTTRNRLKGAAQRRGMEIIFRRTRDNTIVFHLEEKESAS